MGYYFAIVIFIILGLYIWWEKDPSPGGKKDCKNAAKLRKQYKHRARLPSAEGGTQPGGGSSSQISFIGGILFPIKRAAKIILIK